MAAMALIIRMDRKFAQGLLTADSLMADSSAADGSEADSSSSLQSHAEQFQVEQSHVGGTGHSGSSKDVPVQRRGRSKNEKKERQDPQECEELAKREVETR